MISTGASHALAGCDLWTLDSATCEQQLQWLLGPPGTAIPDGATGLTWALAHCDDGVTWGRYDAGAKAWRLGNQIALRISPPISSEALHELRLFGDPGEILIWRTDTGLRGRAIRETAPPSDRNDESNPLRPADESRILRGDRIVMRPEHDFTHVGDRTGAEQVLPLAVSEEQLQGARVRLHVRHYYEQDPETGAVRIAATRLVTLALGGAHGA